MPTLVIKTNASQGTDILIKDMGILIPASGGSVTLTDQKNLEMARVSNNLRALIVDNAFGANSSTIILNNGTANILQADVVTFLDLVNVSRKPEVSTSAPTINDDSRRGFQVSSLWINTTTGSPYVCKSATVGAAVWQKLADGGSGPGHKHDRQVAEIGSVVSTDSATYLDMPDMTLTTNNEGLSSYTIIFTCEAQGSSSSKDIYIRIVIDGITSAFSERTIRPQSGNQYFVLTTAARDDIDNNKVIKIQWRTETSQQDFTVRNRSLLIDGVSLVAVTS